MSVEEWGIKRREALGRASVDVGTGGTHKGEYKDDRAREMLLSLDYPSAGDVSRRRMGALCKITLCGRENRVRKVANWYKV